MLPSGYVTYSSEAYAFFQAYECPDLFRNFLDFIAKMDTSPVDVLADIKHGTFPLHSSSLEIHFQSLLAKDWMLCRRKLDCRQGSR